ncbi:hypothetical protein A0H81_03563 [Grifola frondosa]|uniref:Uncharacterized protein n=1 Tax=Grifola frondosa TaxID=5627 RepID=A0A1C7MJL7_GRIFR|nr:hypothetical protein A0H81_03563 [Grifola frondosa]
MLEIRGLAAATSALGTTAGGTRTDDDHARRCHKRDHSDPRGHVTPANKNGSSLVPHGAGR